MTRNFLSEIVERKREIVAKLRAKSSADELRAHALEIRQKAVGHRLRQALQAVSLVPRIIAEFKRASPSAGTIRNDLSPANIARQYECGGACAISVLTDEDHFDGFIDDLVAVRSSTRLPILRKDFILDPIQVYEAAIAGADAILLIAAVLNDDSLGELRKLAEDELDLDTLVEVHTSEELRRAVNAGMKIIGVNNRDLKTFEVSLGTSERLIAEAPRDRLMISESGLWNSEQLHRLRALGFCGFLMGEALMRTKDPEAALRNLLAAANRRNVSHATLRR